MRSELYPKLVPWMKLLAVVLRIPGRYWWAGLMVIGAMTVFGSASWGHAIVLAIKWGLTIVGSVAALGALAALESRWRDEWSSGGSSAQS
jgi:hypothetical protein